MLTLSLTIAEGYDERTKTFVPLEEVTLNLEHSLAALSKWESHYKKPFLSKVQKTPDEILFYIHCMIISPEDFSGDLNRLTQADIDRIQEHIDDPTTATTFTSREVKKPSFEIITSEIIYYWMVSLNIPFECQHWHLNRLLALIRVCNEKNRTPKKMGKHERIQQQRSLNMKRRSALRSRG